jgi:hypothetical protein
MRVLLIAWLIAASLASSPGRNLIVNGGFESSALPPAAIETYADGSTNIPGWIVVVSHGYASRMTSGYRPFTHVNEFSTPFGSTIVRHRQLRLSSRGPGLAPRVGYPAVPHGHLSHLNSSC